MFSGLSMLLLGFGFGLMIASAVLASRTKAFLARAATAEGVVISMRSRHDEALGQVYAPVVEYQTADGKTVVFKSNTFARKPDYAQGDTVPILYSPERPEDARIQSFRNLWAPAVVVGAVGSVLVLAGATSSASINAAVAW